MRQEVQTQDGLSVREMCEASRISRASYYRKWVQRYPSEEQMAVRDAIQRLALKSRHRGYRYIRQDLKEEGWQVNHKRILRIMREDNLLSIRRRRFVITTDSEHSWKIYPNLARHMTPRKVNQLWVADITYVRLRKEFVYLAVVLDVYSRRVVGWSIAKSLETPLVMAALDQALMQRRPPAGLVHHSDRGVQYASGQYVERLEAHGIVVSMSRPGNPYDNAWAESFFKTLKVEEVNGRGYRDLKEATESIEEFIEEVYNQQRRHSALGYVSPVEFENRGAGPVETAAADGNPKNQDSHSGLKPAASQFPQARRRSTTSIVN